MLKLFTTILVLIPVFLIAQPDSIAPDGPYLMYQEDGTLLARWAWPEEHRAGEAIWTENVAAELPDFPAFRPELVHPENTFFRDPNISFWGVEKIAVVSDIHGQYDVAKKLLLSHGIIDEDQHWAYGEGHFVIVGDIFDRGDQVTELLWFVHNLQREAVAAGGRVHFLLGNHETMILDGDIRYINKRYLITGALFKTPYQDLYGPDTYLGRWLRALPLTIRINNMVFVHGGLSKDLLREVGSLTAINDLYHKQLIDVNTSAVTATSERLNVLHGSNGPLWYRGYFLNRDLEERDIDRILKKIKAKRMIVGHTSFDAIRHFFNGKVLAVDSSMKFGSRGEVLLIEGGNFVRGGLLGERIDLFEAGRK